MIMKKHRYLVLLILLSACWGCSSNSHDTYIDPIPDFRNAAVDLRQLSYYALTQTGVDLGRVDNDDPKKPDYLIAMEDLLFGQTYAMSIFNDVINFSINSVNGTVYTDAEGDSTVDLADGLYVYSSDYFDSEEVEKLNVTFTFDPDTHRWLIIGLRGGSLIEEPSDPWFKQEGEIVNRTEYYFSTVYHLEADVNTHINNALLVYDNSTVIIQMACERPTCDTDCVDTSTTPLFSQGLTALSLLAWDQFKVYGIDDPPPDNEIP